MSFLSTTLCIYYILLNTFTLRNVKQYFSLQSTRPSIFVCPWCRTSDLFLSVDNRKSLSIDKNCAILSTSVCTLSSKNLVNLKGHWKYDIKKNFYASTLRSILTWRYLKFCKQLVYVSSQHDWKVVSPFLICSWTPSFSNDFSSHDLWRIIVKLRNSPNIRYR